MDDADANSKPLRPDEAALGMPNLHTPTQLLVRTPTIPYQVNFVHGHSSLSYPKIVYQMKLEKDLFNSICT